MKMVGTVAAAIVIFCASGTLAGDTRNPALTGALTFAGQEFSLADPAEISSPGAPEIEKRKDYEPYYPGTNESIPEIISPVGNLGIVVDGVYRGARISTDKEFKFLSNMGITTLVNLQYPLRDKDDFCDKYGFDCSYRPVKIVPMADWYFDMKAIKKAFKFTVNEVRAGKKVYIHCHYGRERTGILAAALQIRQEMCTPDRQDDPRLKVKAWEFVEGGFKKFGYKMTYKKPFKEMKSWISDFDKNKKWLCQ